VEICKLFIGMWLGLAMRFRCRTGVKEIGAFGLVEGVCSFMGWIIKGALIPGVARERITE